MHESEEEQNLMAAETSLSAGGELGLPRSMMQDERCFRVLPLLLKVTGVRRSRVQRAEGV